MKRLHIFKLLLVLSAALYCGQLFADAPVILDPVLKKIVHSLAHRISFKLGIHLQNGIAVLSGVAPNDSEATLVIAVVLSTHGVSDIDISKLTLPGSVPIPITDIITGRLEAIYVKNNVFPGVTDVAQLPIAIRTIIIVSRLPNGLPGSFVSVILSGPVDDQATLVNVIKTAQLYPGIDRVSSTMYIRAGAVSTGR